MFLSQLALLPPVLFLAVATSGIESLRVGQVMVLISGYNPAACSVRISWDGNGNAFPATAS